MNKDKIKRITMEKLQWLKGKLKKWFALAVEFWKTHKQFAMSVRIILASIILTIIVVFLRSKPEKLDIQELPPLVQTSVIEPGNIEMVVKGFGTVKPKSEVQIVPQVSGKIVSMNPQFRAGGFIKAGEQLFQIEPQDFELAVEQARAKVAEAEVKRDMEKSEATVARREWQQINPGTEPDSALVLREPQIRQAQASLDSAKAALAKAQLDLKRTSITLPIDVCITTKNVDLGQFLTAGVSVGSAYGIDAVEIEVPLEDGELAWFDIPDSSVKVKTAFAGTEKVFDGIIKRTTGKVDETSRLVYVVVEVANPAQSAATTDTLIPGMFVEVNITGRKVENIFTVNRDWVHNADELWVVNDSVLHIKLADIIRADDEFAYIKQGKDSRLEVVTSSVDAVVNGMKVRIASDK
ncbi:MAG: efflux RND transporter periplasmic adaptor subunit [Sedimentisphaerales bacterium]|nr:efflux RND transporter periplasmic adaptor subunit [Sedimentisphaerales bacterium]